MRHRGIEVRLNRALRARERANRRIADLSGQLRALRTEAAARLGLSGEQVDRLTPLMLDVLDHIEPDGDCWIWTGSRNNKGLPRMRDVENGYAERSACVLLDRMLNNSDGSGIRYPNCRNGRDCVNPAHKRVRGAGRHFVGPGQFSREAS